MKLLHKKILGFNFIFIYIILITLKTAFAFSVYDLIKKKTIFFARIDLESNEGPKEFLSELVKSINKSSKLNQSEKVVAKKVVTNKPKEIFFLAYSLKKYVLIINSGVNFSIHDKVLKDFETVNKNELVQYKINNREVYTFKKSDIKKRAFNSWLTIENKIILGSELNAINEVLSKESILDKYLRSSKQEIPRDINNYPFILYIPDYELFMDRVAEEIGIQDFKFFSGKEGIKKITFKFNSFNNNKVNFKIDFPDTKLRSSDLLFISEIIKRKFDNENTDYKINILKDCIEINIFDIKTKLFNLLNKI